jgi:hypothetical protein
MRINAPASVARPAMASWTRWANAVRSLSSVKLMIAGVVRKLAVETVKMAAVVGEHGSA